MSEEHGASYCLECNNYFWTPTCEHQKGKQVSEKTVQDIARSNLETLIQAAIEQEQKRIIKLLKKEIVNNAVWRAQNRMWSNDWNGGQDTDVEYLISMATSLIALIKGENK